MMMTMLMFHSIKSLLFSLSFTLHIPQKFFFEMYKISFAIEFLCRRLGSSLRPTTIKSANKSLQDLFHDCYDRYSLIDIQFY